MILEKSGAYRKNKIKPRFWHHTQKINSRWIIKLNVRSKNQEAFRRNIGKYLNNIRLRKDFLNNKSTDPKDKF